TSRCGSGSRRRPIRSIRCARACRSKSRFESPGPDRSSLVSLPERILQARALRREQLGRGFGDVHVVLEPDAELALDVDAGFITEGHARLQPERVALDQIRPLVPVHADAVTHAV